MFYDKFFKHSQKSKLSFLTDYLEKKTNEIFEQSNNGNLPVWIDQYNALPVYKVSSIDMNASIIKIGDTNALAADKSQDIEKRFKTLMPWKKGPYSLFGMDVDGEWRSDIKWDRLKDKILPLKGKTVLDVGCANGYHCFRMIGEEAQTVVGADPSLKFVMQFNFINKYANVQNMAVLPLGIEDIPLNCECFDTVFSMGLLYHRRSPFDHLIQLYSFLKEGGELVLETIVFDGKEGEVLMPKNRYAQMPNIWFIPTVETLLMWLEKCRFKDIKVVDVSVTTAKEQRATEWSGKCSLNDFLDPNDKTKTIEGYPAPKRAILTCRK